MSQLRAVAREIWGLFIDDGWFAAAVLVWLGVFRLGLAQLPGAGVVLFSGLALILLVSAVRFARRSPGNG